MRLLALLLLPTLCVAQQLEIMPRGGSLAYDMTEAGEKTIVFTCVGPDGLDGETDLTWYNPNDYPITNSSGRVLVYSSDNSKVLMIASPQDSDAGTYTCKGVIEGEEVEASIRLDLYKGITINSPEHQYPVQGTDAKIMCNATSSMPFNVKWFTGNLVPIKTGEKFLQMPDHLLVRDIQLSDSGEYVCQCAIASLGITKAFHITVTVTIPPKMEFPITQEPATPKEGDDLELFCQAEGTPAPTYMYYKGNVPLHDEPTTNGRYRLEKVSRDNEGIYTCVASNKGGEDRQEVIVDIKIPPKIEPITNVSMQANQKCELTCVAKGDPKPNLFWRRKDRQDYYSTTPADGEEIYVEESFDVEEENEFTSITRTTLKLIIPTLKPEHSSEYVCKAENVVGSEEKTGRIDVQYAPNFSNQPNVGTAFYGWQGGNTNLTCIANGNPEPVIQWLYNGQKINSGTDYTIVAGENNNPTQAVSYLIPSVRPDTLGNVFGMYTCRAINKFTSDGVDQNLEFKQATQPAEPRSVTVSLAKATQFELAIETPVDNGGQPVLRYEVKVYPQDDATNVQTTNAERRTNEETVTKAIVGGLEASTLYVIEVSAVTNVGRGLAKRITEQTTTVSKPEAVHITSNKEGTDATTYTLTWDKPIDNGAEILEYTIEYTKADVEVSQDGMWSLKSPILQYNEKTSVKGADNTFTKLTGLSAGRYYQVRIIAINRIGSSPETTFIFKTGAGEDDYYESDDYEDEIVEEVPAKSEPDQDTKAISDDTKSESEMAKTGEQGEKAKGAALGTGGILAIIIVLLLVLLVAADVAFCFTKQCGVIWTIRSALGRKEEGAATSSKSPEDGDEAAAKLLGKEKDDSLKTENEVAKEAEQAQEAEPEEPKEKELEPEDKEEKLDEPVKTEEPAEEKPKTPVESEAEPPKSESAPEAAPAVETQPPSEEKPDSSANA